jgi:hypothetical protein
LLFLLLCSFNLSVTIVNLQPMINNIWYLNLFHPINIIIWCHFAVKRWSEFMILNSYIVIRLELKL